MTTARGRPPAGVLLRQAASSLRQAGCDQPRLDAEVLLAHAWDRRREDLLIHPGQEVPEPVARRFLALIDRRREHVPVAYLTGSKEFMSLMLMVTPAVLIPRPETELLVEQALLWLSGAERYRRSNSARIGTQDDRAFDPSFGIGPAYRRISQLSPEKAQLPVPGQAREHARGDPALCWMAADVGTGCGAIAVSLACYNPSVRVIATDISPDALMVAAANARRHGVDGRIGFRAGDLLAPLLEREGPGTGALVVANLPYIPSNDLERLPRDVQWEPRLALDGGRDGLDTYRRLVPQAAAWLAPGGLLACEIGRGQADMLGELLTSGGWREVRVAPDYRGEDRVITALR